jgi:hypothetical protein
MAKKRDNDLMKKLQQSGVRKRVARAVSDAAGKTNSGRQPAVVTRTIESLRSAASEIEKRVGGSQRSEAAKKAARTRKRKAAQRSSAARKGAKTRSASK